MNKSLVVGSGAMYGAYGAGVTAELGRQLGSKYFDSIYASSVGVFAGTYFSADQSRIMEEIWRRHIDGRKLINYFRIRNSLNLRYLENIFREGHSLLDIEEVFRSRTRLIYVLTRLRDGKAVYQTPTPLNIFRSMRASAATPILHNAVHLGDEYFIDGAFSDPLPVAKALEDGAQFVVAVNNKRADFEIPRSFYILGMLCKFFSRSVSQLVNDYEIRVRKSEEALQNRRVIVIRPSERLPLRSSVDTDAGRLNATIDLGIKDARVALEKLPR
ncbi:MAG: patatin-like phospholipase family protein [Candidatus Moranbacteria bacterium]|nr:patatin-like phospholipase family protein [Candidatus Moranbacteria bacterium]